VVVTSSAADPRCDGDWWPASSDVVAELTAVLPLVQSHAGHVITRVSLDMGAWPEPHPRRLVVASQLLRVGWFPRLRLILHLHPAPSSVVRKFEDSA
jgi:hypothetical protein